MAVDWLRHSCTYRAIFKEGFFDCFAKGFSESYAKGFSEGFAERFAETFPEEKGDVQIRCHRKWLYYLGKEWLGLPSAEVRATIEAIDDVSKMKELVEKLSDERLKISTWDDLLASP